MLDARTYKEQCKEGIAEPFDQAVISIVSYNFAATMAEKLRLIPWDLVVIDEAHRLRNAHRDSHRTGQAIKKAFGSLLSTSYATRLRLTVTSSLSLYTNHRSI